MAKVRDDNLLEYIKTYGIEGYSVSLHGVRSLTGDSHESICQSACENGITMNGRYRSLNGTVRGIGITPQNDEHISEELQDYIWDTSQQLNLIIAYPQVIENSKGEKLYLGFTRPPKSGYDQDTQCSFMDIICSELGRIPKEFVLGYYIDKDRKYGLLERGEHMDYDFTSNPHFNKISDELFEEMKNALDVYARLSTAYAEGDLEEVNSMKKLFASYGLTLGKVIENSDNEVFGGKNRQY